MPDIERLISALHCRAQDLMIDPPACDGCDYHDQLESINNGGCNIKRLCKDFLDLLNEQEAKIRQLKLALEIAKGTCNGIVADGR